MEEIIRLAFLKYRLSGRRSMNTFIFTQAKSNKLTDEQIENILNELENKINEYNIQNMPEQLKEAKFTCNIWGKMVK